jgi:hypothetical protein
MFQEDGVPPVPNQSPSLKARLQHILVSLEGPEETRGLCVHILKLLYIFCFGGHVP